MASLLQTVDADGIATLTINRPEVQNAFDDALILDLTAALEACAAEPRVSAVILAANGKNFSAGADLNWMKRMSMQGEAENLADTKALAKLMHTLNFLPKPTIALVQGAVYAGGVGLVSCCDIVVAADSATFCISEVRIGLIPSVISPYIIAAIGQRAARRYFFTTELFSAQRAQELGLVSDIVPLDHLLTRAAELVAAIKRGGPTALAAAKQLIFAVSERPIDAEVIEDTCRRVAHRRTTDEFREGVRAFLEKRKPSWLTA